MLDCNGVWFDKPVDRDHARAHLAALRGPTHELIAAVAVVRDRADLWHLVARAPLTVRPFGVSFPDDSLDRVGAVALLSVVAYHLEGLVAHLFRWSTCVDVTFL